HYLRRWPGGDREKPHCLFYTNNAAYDQLFIKFSWAWSFLKTKILQIDAAKIQSFVNSYDKLQKFAFDLKLINEKRPHILDAETEKVLSEAQNALSALSKAVSYTHLTYTTTTLVTIYAVDVSVKNK
ncbi:hypothetical protein, partial [Escherichia coli]|uniref:hypothetical protein n=1 Tax=Escherichia coli TaxID=562 RepID=UPI001BC8AE2D